MTGYFLGVDIGGSKSHALIADAEGQAVGFGVAGPGSYEVVGVDGLRATLTEIVEQALEQAGITAADISGAGFGFSGYDWPAEYSIHREAVDLLGLSAPCEIVNDTLIGLLAGASAGWGVALVAGSGCNCWGRDARGREGRMTGGGSMLGEGAGGGEVVLMAVQAIVADWSRRGPRTALSEAFMAMAGLDTRESLVEALAMRRFVPTEEAALVVFEKAAGGDAVALDIVRRAGRQLGELAVGVIRQLELEHEAVEIVLVGGMHRGGPLLSEPMKAVILEVAPRATFIRLAKPPVIGGVCLAMAAAGLDYLSRREMLFTSFESLR